MGSWTIRILCAAPGSVAGSTSPGPARADVGHRPSTHGRQQHPFSPPQQWKDGALPLNCREGGSGRCSYLSWKWSRAVDVTPWLWM